jgi:hypothetical protein
MEEEHTTETAMLLRMVLDLERNSKIDGTNVANWRDNVNENLAALNSKQSTAEMEALFQTQMYKLYNER